jgi:hypothetical protein
MLGPVPAVQVMRPFPFFRGKPTAKKMAAVVVNRSHFGNGYLRTLAF